MRGCGVTGHVVSLPCMVARLVSVPRCLMRCGCCMLSVPRLRLRLMRLEIRGALRCGIAGRLC